jgi:hypothetical protein
MFANGCVKDVNVNAVKAFGVKEIGGIGPLILHLGT